MDENTEQKQGISILVCGGRNCKTTWLLGVLNSLHKKHKLVQVFHEGGRRTAAETVLAWAKRNRVPAKTVSPLWEVGPERNEALLSLKPDKVVAFPGGAVEHNLVRQALDTGVDVVFIA